MRTRVMLVVAVLVTLVLGACADGQGAMLSSATTVPDDPTVTTIDLPPTPLPDDPRGGGGDGDDGDDGDDGEGCGDPPVWVLKSTDDPADEPSDDGDDVEPTEDDCDLPGPELGTGDVQITLRWSSDADLDLHVFEPDGREIWFGDHGPTSTGGQLDVDSNVGCVNDGSVENVFWPEGEVPLGEYRIEIHGFTVDGCGGGDYTVTAKVQGEEILNETGSVEESETDTYTFEVS